MSSTNHLDYADAAEAAERGRAWQQATALWRKAIELCDKQARIAMYEAAVARCEAAVAVDVKLAAIAKRISGIPTMETRKSDSLDFHEVAVWSLKEALWLAYHLDR